MGEEAPSKGAKDLVRVMDGETLIGHFDPSTVPKSKRTRRGRPKGTTATSGSPDSGTCSSLSTTLQQLDGSLWALPDLESSPKKISPNTFPSNQQSWECLSCGKAFASKSNLQIHATIHSGERYACETCNKCFTQKCNLKRHEATHSGAKSYSCVRCGRMFTQKANLQRHFGIHTGKRCFSCEECGKYFIQKCNLKKHLERHTEKLTFPFVECVLTEDPT